MTIFNPSRDQVRDFFVETWRKFRFGNPLTPIEQMAIEIVHAHPEYHAVLEHPNYRSLTYFPEQGETNPFLHMSLHLSILEQISINQPQGIREIYETLQSRMGNDADAQHLLMECLAEIIWQSQRNKVPLDQDQYLSHIKNVTKM
jgi:Domain of unknown function (DUF1841)